MIKRKTKRRSSELAELDRASREIESRIQELEASLKRPSQQTRMRLDRNTAFGRATRTGHCVP